VLAAVLLGVDDCEEAKPLPVFRVTFAAETDGEPLPGVDVVIDGRHLGTTGPDGALRHAFQAAEGSAVAIHVQCPDGYRAAEEIPLLRLRQVRHLTKESVERGIPVPIVCPPAERLAVVVVRTGEPDLPIRYLGREIERTDAAGFAQIMLPLEPPESFSLEIDSSANPKLRPRNPTATFALGDADQIFLFDQLFRERESRHRAPRITAPLGPVRPVKIN
jgi:hypothetical protein